jgi:hypothetical protein
MERHLHLEKINERELALDCLVVFEFEKIHDFWQQCEKHELIKC